MGSKRHVIASTFGVYSSFFGFIANEREVYPKSR
jgi:hypothetical protein